MIHPSTMAGPNWFTGNFGTTNPFQQNTTPFSRTNPFQGSQGGYGFGTNPFQGSQGGFGIGANPFQNTGFGFGTNPFQTIGFGTNPGQIQNAINEIVRQTVPTIISGYGFQPTNGFQNLSGNWTSGNPFQGTPGFDWQTQSFVGELIRQTTNQALQNLAQSGITGGFGTTWGNNPNFGFNPQQQQLWNAVGQICQQACQQICQTTCQAIVTCAIATVNQQNQTFNTWNLNTTGGQQQFWNTCGQICQQACQQLCQTTCQAIVTCAIATVNQQQNTPYNLNTQGTPFNLNTQNTPFNFTTNAPQYGFTPGIPTGAGAF